MAPTACALPSRSMFGSLMEDRIKRLSPSGVIAESIQEVKLSITSEGLPSPATEIKRVDEPLARIS